MPFTNTIHRKPIHDPMKTNKNQVSNENNACDITIIKGNDDN